MGVSIDSDPEIDFDRPVSPDQTNCSGAHSFTSNRGPESLISHSAQQVDQCGFGSLALMHRDCICELSADSVSRRRANARFYRMRLALDINRDDLASLAQTEDDPTCTMRWSGIAIQILEGMADCLYWSLSQLTRLRLVALFGQ